VPAPKSIDDYLRTVAPAPRAALTKLRRTIATLLPDAEECISYSMPAFRYHGKVVAGFLARKGGCSYFPFSGSTLGSLAGTLDGYDQTKSALHFSPSTPLPKALVKKLLDARIAELAGPPEPRARRATQSSGKRRATRKAGAPGSGRRGRV
jgi:uncharacterized protein YdhG (YjbR/CyaY superfamily)